MKRQQMVTTEEMVREILKKDKQCRNDDKRLICTVYRQLGISVERASFKDVLMMKGIPSIETITRVRRRCQLLNKELRADENVDELRRDSETEVLQYLFDY